MAPIFAFADIATLLNDFPPVEPSKGTPSLFRTRSGSGLLDSRNVFHRLDGLLNGANGKGPSRVKIQALPDLFQVRSSQQVLDCYNGPLHFSRDTRSLIAHGEFNAIVDELQNRARSLFVRMATFAAEHDIAVDFADVEALSGRELCQFADPVIVDDIHIASVGLVSDVRNQLQQCIAQTSTEETDISSISAGAPIYVLKAMAADLGLSGELEARNEKVAYVPSGYREKQSEAASEQMLQDVRQELNIAGWVYLPEGIDIEKLRNSIEHSDSPMEVLELMDGKKAAVQRNVLDETLRSAHAQLSLFAPLDQFSDVAPTFDRLMSSVQMESERPDLIALLTESQYRQSMEVTLADARARHDLQRRDEFIEVFQELVLAPLHLYGSVDYQNTTLKEHQEVFLGDYFANSVLLEFLKAAWQQRSLRKGHIRIKSFHIKDLEPLAAVSQAGPKRLAELREIVTNFAKKHKIPNPHPDTVHRVQRDLMRQQYMALLKKQRPSDILQHVIWIVLAQATEGMCVSAGKDTSRMIEQYKTVGDLKIWQKLVKWKDLLKADGQEAEDLEEMKELANIAVTSPDAQSAAADST